MTAAVMPGLGDAEEGSTVAFDELGGWPGVLNRLSAGASLDAAEAESTLCEILAGRAAPSQIAAWLFGLRCKGVTIDEMTGMVRAMIAAAEAMNFDEALRVRLVDTCGTGGDRSGTINVSTVAALVVAGAGVPVCKHGGRAATSQAGSADVLEALGVAIDLGPAGVRRCIDEVGIGFCLAPRYHPAMRHAAQVRSEFGVATVFNFLGPLANPARLHRQVVGVGDPAMAEKVRGVLAANGASRVMVVYGSDGLDELTTTGTSTVLEWIADREIGADGGGAGVMRTTTVDPRDLDIAPARLSDLVGGDVATNARAAMAILNGSAGPQRDIVVLNAAAALVVSGTSPDLYDGALRAAASLDDGSARKALTGLIDVSNDSHGASS